MPRRADFEEVGSLKGVETPMSLDKIGHIKQLMVTLDGKPISQSEKLLIFVLAHYHDAATGEAWASLDRLAAESLNTETEVIRILQGLERKAVLRMI